jgi:hypothetical protein
MIIYLDICSINYYSFALQNYKMVTVIKNLLKQVIKADISLILINKNCSRITHNLIRTKDINLNEVFAC